MNVMIVEQFLLLLLCIALPVDSFVGSIFPRHLNDLARTTADANSESRDPFQSKEDCKEEESLLGAGRLGASRRDVLQSSVTMTMLSTLAASMLFSDPQSALAAEGGVLANTAAQSQTDPSDAVITDKVYMDVRISRQDGTFYVRDDLPDTPENRVFYGRLVIGLFGKNAPVHCERFLSYITASASPLDENPLPSYGRSVFTSLDPPTGLLVGGYIPSLQVSEVAGQTALRYGSRIIPASLWIENRRGETIPPPVSHSKKGLLTHRVLEVMPTFGITTRSDTRELDSTHVVFGRLLSSQETKPSEGDNKAAEFLDIVRDLPVYSVERPSMVDPLNEDPVNSAAQAVYNAQKNFFRGAAKSFGDTRLDKIYEGKLLRRVEVTQAGSL